MAVSEIILDTVASIDVEELVEFYQRQGHRTTTSRSKLHRMVDASHCFVTARHAGRLIGMARGVSDGVNGYLAECKLDPSYQGPGAITHTDGRIEHDRDGVATEMARRVVESLRADGAEQIHAIAYGTEVDFCEALGFRKIGGMVALRLEAGALMPAESLAGQGG